MYHIYKIKEYLSPKAPNPDISIIDIMPIGERFTVDNSTQIGSGTFGQVFIGVDIEESKNVAMKRLKWPTDKEKKNVIKKEVAILAKMHHVNIAKLVKAFRPSTKSNCIYIAMELCSGGELFDVISNRGHLTEEDAKKVIKEMLGALVYCHHLGIAHLDLKPENILLSEKPSEDLTVPLPSIKLIDWGLSAEFEAFDHCPEQCRRKGTPAYMAPEIFRKNYNEEVDLWAVGVILYIMLIGFWPFDPHNIMPKFKGDHFHPPRREDVKRMQLNGQYSQKVKAFVKTLMAYDPTERPTAAEALNDPWFNSMSTTVVPHETVGRLKHFIKTRF